MEKIMLPNKKLFDFGLVFIILTLLISGCQVESPDYLISVDISAVEEFIEGVSIQFSSSFSEISS